MGKGCNLPSQHCVSDYVSAWTTSPFAYANESPWLIVQQAEVLIRAAFSSLGSEFHIDGDIALHRSAIIENGSVLKGPMIIGADCFIASGAYIRGAVYLAAECTIGPGCELKTSFMFAGSKIAHLSFVGDSILGSNVNIEAGAIIANYRNELADKAIRIRVGDTGIDTGVEKFGALVGDGSRIGANAVVAPGALIAPDTRIARLSLVDQYPFDGA